MPAAAAWQPVIGQQHYTRACLRFLGPCSFWHTHPLVSQPWEPAAAAPRPTHPARGRQESPSSQPSSPGSQQKWQVLQRCQRAGWRRRPRRHRRRRRAPPTARRSCEKPSEQRRLLGPRLPMPAAAAWRGPVVAPLPPSPFASAPAAAMKRRSALVGARRSTSPRAAPPLPSATAMLHAAGAAARQAPSPAPAEPPVSAEVQEWVAPFLVSPPPAAAQPAQRQQQRHGVAAA